MENLTSYTFTLDEDQKIILDKISTPHFHHFVWRAIKVVIDGLRVEDLAGFRRRRSKNVNKQAIISQATTVLDNIEGGLNILGDLVNRSPTFRKHMNHRSIEQWLSKMSNTGGRESVRPQVGTSCFNLLWIALMLQ